MRLKFARSLLLFMATLAWGEPHLFNIKLSVSNPTQQERPNEQIVVPLAPLRKIAPGLKAGSMIVTATDAATIEQGSAELQTSELPSQVDDLDGDNKADELAFEISLKPGQTRIVTITYGEPNRILRLRGEYPQRTQALFATRIEGMGWESESTAWRIYFDPRNAIDLYGKTRHTLFLQTLATPEYDYHSDSPYGRDIYRIGDALGIGSIGGLVDGKVVKVSDVANRKWRLISNGPVRSIFELTYEGWKVGGRSITLRSRISQWAGDRGFYQSITSDDTSGLEFVTGLPRKSEVHVVRSETRDPNPWLTTYGEQVVMPGVTATEKVQGMNLGLGVILLVNSAKPLDDAANNLFTFTLQNGTASWYTTAAWDQEGAEDRTSIGGPNDARQYIIRADQRGAITNEREFLEDVKGTASRLRAKAEIKILSTAAVSQSAPPGTLTPAQSKTYEEAVNLLRSEIERTATKWEPILKGNNTAAFTKTQGAGFFTEADNHTGEWKPQKGYFWTGSFWTGELWAMYAQTKGEKYRRWAEEWTAAVLGQESNQNHDAGFLYFYSSVPAYQATKDPKYLNSAMKAAQRLEKLFNPTTHLIPSWTENGDDTIIDTMMNLQLLWWASKQTGDPKWQEIALQHALRAADWMIREDGSDIHSVHYNPGDNRQEFELHGAGREGTISIPNETAPGQLVFTHTHQGYAADTAWSRGDVWAMYGFAAGYKATHDQRLLQTAEKIANYILDELPEDGVPWYDFYDEGVHFRNRDTSAAAIAAGGLLELSTLTPDQQKAQVYRVQSERIVHSLIDSYLTPVGSGDTTPPGVLRHGSSTRPADGALIYGQYFLLETLLKLQANADTHPSH